MYPITAVYTQTIMYSLLPVLNSQVHIYSFEHFLTLQEKFISVFFVIFLRIFYCRDGEGRLESTDMGPEYVQG